MRRLVLNSAMKRVLQLCAVAALTMVPTTARADAEAVPFAGTFEGSSTATPCAPLTICLEGSLEGVARHLGRTTMTKSAVVQFTFTPCPGGTGSTFSETITLTGANGDTLEMSGTGEACAGGGVSTGSAALTVTGGTGRFANASGSLSETFTHDLVTGLETLVLRGTISAPGA
jgi:hypothetical protein